MSFAQGKMELTVSGPGSGPDSELVAAVSDQQSQWVVQRHLVSKTLTKKLTI